MKFEIIKNSESFTGFEIADNEYMGQTCNLNGWSFEMLKASGEVCYSSVYFTTQTPEAYINGSSSEYLRWCMGLNGLSFTGRVVFRGYYSEYYDLIDGKWEPCVEEVAFDIGDLLYADEDDDECVYDDRYDYLYDIA